MVGDLTDLKTEDLHMNDERHLHLGHAHNKDLDGSHFKSHWAAAPNETGQVAGPHLSQSFGIDLAYDVHKQGGVVGQDLQLPAAFTGTGASERVSDANIWLPHAAEVYNLSRRIQDYVLVPVVGLFSSLPNTNGDSVSLNELLRFNPFHGQQSYKIWKGQPTFTEHDNQDYLKSKGVILDVFLRPLKRFGAGKYYKLVMLHAFDRTKDPLLVNRILNREINSYSVGFYFKAYKCSVCGFHATEKTKGFCEHTKPRQVTYQHNSGFLSYRSCFDIKPFESSSVEVPAFVTAISDNVMDPLKA